MSQRCDFSRLGGLTLATWGILGLVLVALAGPPTARAASTDWHDTGLTLPDATDTNGYCIDSTRPNILYVNEGDMYAPKGTLAYNWQTGQKTSLSQQQFSICANGFLYATPKDKPALRFGLDNPTGTVLAHKPVVVAKDGSLLTYGLDQTNWDDYSIPATQAQNHLWFSPDGGLTWQERGQNLTGVFQSLIVSPGDARSIYLLTRSLKPDQKGPTGNIENYTLTVYYSGDAGVTWDKRSAITYPGYGNPPYLQSFTPLNSPINDLMLVSMPRGSHGGIDYNVSLDGGRTFNLFDHHCTYDCNPTFYNSGSWIDFGARNLLRFDFVANDNGNPSYPTKAQLEALQDNGSWKAIPFPEETKSLYVQTPQIVGNTPNNLLITAVKDFQNAKVINQEEWYPDRMVWYSPDSGQTWQKLPGTMETILPTPYSPLTLLGIKGGRLYTFDLPEQLNLMTQWVSTVGGPNILHYRPTGHNFSDLFLPYYEAHGSLYQFGYPWTEPFREISPTDGKVYLVQYFERNRFEYHPEFAGTAYEVLLGLLGSQLTAQRQAAGEGAFNHFSDMHYPGGTYFLAVGHNLRNGFKAYWEAHGGLAIYGYPISEEFEEVNPDDGKTYVVQYFERARFEYHPEYKGTQDEVLLGLLGNSLLRLKGFFFF